MNHFQGDFLNFPFCMLENNSFIEPNQSKERHGTFFLSTPYCSSTEYYLNGIYTACVRFSHVYRNEHPPPKHILR